ncbi:MAG: cobalamin biosynthesis protein [Paracoccaceae bacterium]
MKRVAGIGFRKGASAQSILSALLLAGGRPDMLATPADKADEPGLVEAATRLGLPVIAVAVDDLPRVDTLTHSPRVAAMRGTGSVAEACALLAAGPGARLLAPRVVSPCRQATAALAEVLP